MFSLEDLIREVSHYRHAAPAIVQRVWGKMWAYVAKNLVKGKGVSIKKFGTFTLSFDQVDSQLKSQRVVTRPVFVLAKSFACFHNVRKETKASTVEVSGKTPVSALNPAWIATEADVAREIVQGCLNDIFLTVGYAMRRGDIIHLEMEGVGKIVTLQKDGRALDVSFCPRFVHAIAEHQTLTEAKKNTKRPAHKSAVAQNQGSARNPLSAAAPAGPGCSREALSHLVDGARVSFSAPPPAEFARRDSHPQAQTPMSSASSPPLVLGRRVFTELQLPLESPSPTSTSASPHNNNNNNNNSAGEEMQSHAHGRNTNSNSSPSPDYLDQMNRLDQLRRLEQLGWMEQQHHNCNPPSGSSAVCNQRATTAGGDTAVRPFTAPAHHSSGVLARLTAPFATDAAATAADHSGSGAAGVPVQMQRRLTIENQGAALVKNSRELRAEMDEYNRAAAAARAAEKQSRRASNGSIDAPSASAVEQIPSSRRGSMLQPVMEAPHVPATFVHCDEHQPQQQHAAPLVLRPFAPVTSTGNSPSSHYVVLSPAEWAKLKAWQQQQQASKNEEDKENVPNAPHHWLSHRSNSARHSIGSAAATAGDKPTSPPRQKKHFEASPKVVNNYFRTGEEELDAKKKQRVAHRDLVAEWRKESERKNAAKVARDAALKQEGAAEAALFQADALILRDERSSKIRSSRAERLAAWTEQVAEKKIRRESKVAA